MKRTYNLIVILFAVAVALGAFYMGQPAAAQGEKIVMYMQMGGTQGDGTTLARTTGAEKEGSGRTAAGRPPGPEGELRRQLFSLLESCSIAMPADCSPDVVRRTR